MKIFFRSSFAVACSLASIGVLPVPSIASSIAKFPPHCSTTGIKFIKNDVSLFSKRATHRLYAIQNTSNQSLWLTHTVANPSASAGWDSQLASQHWSTILMKQPHFSLSCQIQQKSGKMRSVPCNHVLKVCQFTHVHSKKPLVGQFWMIENQPASTFLSGLHGRGLSF